MKNIRIIDSMTVTGGKVTATFHRGSDWSVVKTIITHNMRHPDQKVNDLTFTAKASGRSIEILGVNNAAFLDLMLLIAALENNDREAALFAVRNYHRNQNSGSQRMLDDSSSHIEWKKKREALCKFVLDMIQEFTKPEDGEKSYA